MYSFNSFFFVVCLVCMCIVQSAHGSISSFGLQTAQSVRSAFKDSDFVIVPAAGTVIRTPTFTVRSATLSSFPVLAGVDVQSQITRVSLKAGKPFIRHLHPRSAEIFNAIQGKFEISFTFEGLSPRVVTNIIESGQSTVFPQGLVHTTKCVSRNNCRFLSVFTSADPGLVPV